MGLQTNSLGECRTRSVCFWKCTCEDEKPGQSSQKHVLLGIILFPVLHVDANTWTKNTLALHVVLEWMTSKALHRQAHPLTKNRDTDSIIITSLWWNWGSERLSHLPKVTQLACGRDGMQTQLSLTLEPMRSAASSSAAVPCGEEAVWAGAIVKALEAARSTWTQSLKGKWISTGDWGDGSQAEDPAWGKGLRKWLFSQCDQSTRYPGGSREMGSPGRMGSDWWRASNDLERNCDLNLLEYSFDFVTLPLYNLL